MILCIRDPRINQQFQQSGRVLNPVAFLYLTITHRDRYHGHSPIYNSIKAKNKVSWDEPNQEVEDLYYENFKSPKKEIKKDTWKWKGIRCFLIGRIDMVKNDHSTKDIYRFTITIKIPTMLYTEIEKKKKRKTYMNQKRTWTAKAFLSKKNTRGISIPHFKKCYSAIKIKAVWYWIQK